MQGYPEGQRQPDPADAAVQASAHLVCQHKFAFRDVLLFRLFVFDFILILVLLHNRINILRNEWYGWS